MPARFSPSLRANYNSVRVSRGVIRQRSPFTELRIPRINPVWSLTTGISLQILDNLSHNWRGVERVEMEVFNTAGAQILHELGRELDRQFGAFLCIILTALKSLGPVCWNFDSAHR